MVKFKENSIGRKGSSMCWLKINTGRTGKGEYILAENGDARKFLFKENCRIYY